MDRIAYEKDRVSYPDQASSPIPGLPIFEDGFVCKACSYICRHRTGMQSHCREEHGWINPQRKGRQKKGAQQDKVWEEG